MSILLKSSWYPLGGSLMNNLHSGLLCSNQSFNAPPTKPSAYANISLTTRWGSTDSIARPQASLTSWLHVSGIVGTNSIWSMKNRKAQRYIASSPTNAAWSAALCQKPLQPSSVRSSIPARKTLRFMTIFIPISRN